MWYDPEIVIGVAKREVGYHEKKSNKDLDDKTANPGDKNWTKYARDLDAIGYYNGRKNGVPNCGWCDIFVDWCFYKAYGLEAGLKLVCQTKGANNCGAGPKYSRIYFQAKKQLVKDPQPGDQVFFHPASGGDSISHTGLVVDVDKTYVYTIEGNTSGGMVAEKKYKKTDARVADYGRPAWGEKPEAPELPEEHGEPEAVYAVALYDGPGEDADIAAIAEYGEELEYVATAVTGRHAVEKRGRIYWADPGEVRIIAVMGAVEADGEPIMIKGEAAMQARRSEAGI